MNSAAATLDHVRHILSGIDPSLRPALPMGVREVAFAPGIDAALGGGLSCGAFHELAPAGPFHLAAAAAFALGLAARSGGSRGETLWIMTDFAVAEAGGPYGPGLDLFGLDSRRLIVLRVPKAADVLWAMEEALRCRALSGVIAELTGEGAAADLTATRRLSLAAREGQGTCLGLLLRHGLTPMPSAAATRWTIAAAASVPDRYGGLGPTAFDLSLTKNRRGACGRWIVTLDRQNHVFQPSLPVTVAAPPVDRPDRTLLRYAG